MTAETPPRCAAAASRGNARAARVEVAGVDHVATEKIGYPPRKLSTSGAPAEVNPSVGDIAYYAPWGNLTVFCKDFGYSKGLSRLGRTDSGIEAQNVPGSPKVTIERVGK